MVDFLHARRQLGFPTAVYNMHLGSQAQCRPRGIHRYIPAANNRYFLPPKYRRIIIFQIGFHQIVPGQKLIGGKHAVRVFSRYPHKLWQPRAGTDKYRRKTFLAKKFVDGCRLANHNIRFYLYSQRFYILNLRCNHRLFRKAEFRDAIYQHTARLMERLENCHIVPRLRKLPCTGQTRRSRTDNRNFLPLLFHRRLRTYSVLPRPVRRKALKLTDGNRIALNAPDTFCLALALLRTDTSTDSRKCGIF